MTEDVGLRYNQGKTPYHMIPMHLLSPAAEVFKHVTTRKVNPYPTFNWLKPNDWSVPYASLMRHLAKWYSGEDNDPETGMPHLAHAMCNMLMLEHYRTSYPEYDDRPKEWFSKPAETKLAKAAPLHHIALEMKENNDNEQGTSGRTIEQYYDSLEQRRVSDIRPNVQSYTS